VHRWGGTSVEGHHSPFQYVGVGAIVMLCVFFLNFIAEYSVFMRILDDRGND